METRTYNVYKFSELKPEVQEKAIERWYETEEYPFLEEDILYKLGELDTMKLFEDIKLQYSLSYCQGDGLSFSANINLANYLKAKKYPKKKAETILENVYRFVSTGNKARYSYAIESQIEWEEQCDLLETLVDEIDKIREDIANYYMDICKKLEKYGYSILEYRMNKEEFEEHCEANGYMFTESGKID